MPSTFDSGETVIFRESFGDFPAGTWTGKLYLWLDGTAVANFTATADGSDHLFTLSSTGTGALAAGRYDYAIYVTSGSEKARAKTGYVSVLQDLSETATKTPAQLQLDAANTAFLSLVGSKNQSVSFNGQSFSTENRMSLLNIISRLKNIVKAEQAEQRGLRGNPVSRTLRPYFQ